MKAVQTSNAPKAIGPYSQGIISNGFLYISGQGGFTPETGNIVPGGVEAEAEQACKNVKAIIEAAGGDITNTVKTLCFLADINDFAAFNGVYGKYFTGKPARSCIAVKDLPKGLLCEIEAVVEL